MSKVRNPHLIPTGALLAGTSASGVNTEKAITIEEGIAVNELNFSFPQGVTEKYATWEMVDKAARDTEFTSLVVDTTVWASGTTRLPFITPSIATIETLYGINLDLVDQINVGTKVESLTSPTVYQIVFTYEAIGFGPKDLFWNFTLEASRDTVIGELTNAVAGMTFL